MIDIATLVTRTLKTQKRNIRTRIYNITKSRWGWKTKVHGRIPKANLQIAKAEKQKKTVNNITVLTRGIWKTCSISIWIGKGTKREKNAEKCHSTFTNQSFCNIQITNSRLNLKSVIRFWPDLLDSWAEDLLWVRRRSRLHREQTKNKMPTKNERWEEVIFPITSSTITV